MFTKNCSFKYTLLIAAMMQILPGTSFAAKADKEESEANVCDDCPDPSGRNGWVEVGVGYQSDDSAHFGRYTGQEESGGTLNLSGEVHNQGKVEGAYYDGRVSNLGLDSRSISVEGGKQGRYSVGIDYDQIPNYRLGSNSDYLKTERDRLGVKFSMLPSKNWEISGHYRQENKEGNQDLGAFFGAVTLYSVPVDYQTNDFGVSVGYQGEKLQVRAAYDASFFENGQAEFFLGAFRGSLAEAPDNQFHKLSVQLGYQLSDTTRIGATLARSHLEQDQAFLPYGTGAGLPATTNLDGQVDTVLAKFDINSRPSAKLRLDASYTYSDRDNKTPVNTYNYYLADSSAVPLTTRTNRPYGFEQNLLRVKIGYLISAETNVAGGYDYDKINRTYQQVEQTEDQTVWAKLKMQPAETVEATLKVSHAERDTSAPITTSPAAAFQNPIYPESGVNYALATTPNPLMLAFEYADRTREKIGLDLAFNPAAQISLGVNVDYYQDKYKNMVLGLTDADGLSITPNLTWQVSDTTSATVFYTYDRLKSSQANREWTDAPPSSTDWLENDTNLTQTVGLTVNWKAIPKKLDLGADLIYSDFNGKMQYPGFTDLPELNSRLTSIGVHGTYALKNNWTMRASYRYERYRDNDWAYANWPVTVNTSPATLISAWTTSGNQDTQLVYVALRYAFK